jgi:hypothetical protein
MSYVKKIVLSAENIQEEIPEDHQVVEVFTPVAMAEMGDANTEVRMLHDQIENALFDTYTLDQIASVVAKKAETGMAPETADAVICATESIYARYNLNSNPVPAVECFGEGTRVMFTSIAVENIKQAVETMWKAIINAIKTAYGHVVNFLKKIGASALSVLNKAKGMLAKVKEAPMTDTPNQLMLGNSASASANEDMEESPKKVLSASAITLLFGQSTDTPALFRSSAVLSKVINESSHLVSTATGCLKAGEEVLKAYSENKSMEQIVFPSFVKGLALSGKSDTSIVETKGTRKHRSEMLPGGVCLMINGAEEGKVLRGADGVAAMSKTSIFIGPWDASAKMPLHKAVPVLSKDNIQKLLEEAIVLSTTVQIMQQHAEKLQSEFKSFADGVGNFKYSEEYSADEEKISVHDIRGMVVALKSTVSYGIPAVYGYAIRVSNAMVDYCGASVTCYNKTVVS